MKRVLLVDDDAMLQALIEVGLQSEGYETTCVANGKEAQQAIGQESYDAIVLDLLMPVMDGARFAQWLREEAGLDTPVLVLSAMVDEHKAEALRSYANMDFLCKPAGLDRILDRLKTLVGD